MFLMTINGLYCHRQFRPHRRKGLLQLLLDHGAPGHAGPPAVPSPPARARLQPDPGFAVDTRRSLSCWRPVVWWARGVTAELTGALVTARWPGCPEECTAPA